MSFSCADFKTLIANLLGPAEELGLELLELLDAVVVVCAGPPAGAGDPVGAGPGCVGLGCAGSACATAISCTGAGGGGAGAGAACAVAGLASANAGAAAANSGGRGAGAGGDISADGRVAGSADRQVVCAGDSAGEGECAGIRVDAGGRTQRDRSSIGIATGITPQGAYRGASGVVDARST